MLSACVGQRGQGRNEPWSIAVMAVQEASLQLSTHAQSVLFASAPTATVIIFGAMDPWLRGLPLFQEPSEEDESSDDDSDDDDDDDSEFEEEN